MGTAAASAPFLRPNLAVTPAAWASRAVGSAIGAGQDIASQKIADPNAPIDWQRAGLQAGYGGLFSGEPTALGESLYNTGGRVGQGIGASAAQIGQGVRNFPSATPIDPFFDPSVPRSPEWLASRERLRVAAQAAGEAQQAKDAATAAQAAVEQRAAAESARRARLLALAKQPWKVLLRLDENGDKLPERGGESGTSETSDGIYLQGYNEPETKLNTKEKEAVQNQYAAYKLPTEPAKFFPAIANLLGMDWDAMNVEVIPYGATKDSAGNDVSHIKLGINTAGFTYDSVNGKRYILTSEHYLDGNKPYHDAVVAAHELRHVEVFNQAVDRYIQRVNKERAEASPNDWKEATIDDANKYLNLCKNNVRCYNYGEVDAQKYAIESIQKKMKGIPKVVLDGEKKYIEDRKFELTVFKPKNYPITDGYDVYDFLKKNGKNLK